MLRFWLLSRVKLYSRLVYLDDLHLNKTGISLVTPKKWPLPI